MSWGGIILNVFIESDRPEPESGTPNSWQIAVANASGATITISADAVCAGPAGSSANAAAQAHSAKIVTKALTKLP